jgi:hypothetical protein
VIGKTTSHCKIHEKLGQGGIGVVYKAEGLKPDRLLVVGEAEEGGCWGELDQSASMTDTRMGTMAGLQLNLDEPV